MNLFSLTPVGRKVSLAEDKINKALPNILNKTKYTIESYVPHNALELANETTGYADGAYSDGIIYITNDSLEDTVIHEYGHLIHYQLFNAKVFDIPSEGKSERACVNHREDFAEAFKDFILNNEKSNLIKRDQYMKDLFSSY